jgi:hypothetical protein
LVYKTIKLFLQDGVDKKCLIEIGSCSLHVLHGSIQTGHTAAEWKINSFLQAIYRNFKDSPARRQDFFEITGT